MISVLIPVYNTPAKFIRESINSSLKQTINDYEIIIVDNGSTSEETKTALSEYLDNDKVSIFHCEQQDGKNNISIALNLGLSKCNYEFVARMDSDDIMFHDRLQKQLDFMNKNPDADIIGAQIKVFPDNYVTRHPKIITNEIAKNSSWFINHPTVMFKKSKILEIGGYSDTPEFAAEDYVLWMTAIRSGLKIMNMPDTVLSYRSHGNNLTRKREKQQGYFESIENQKQKLIDHINNI